MSFSRKWLRENDIPEEFHDLLIDKSQSTETPLRQQRDEALKSAERADELKQQLEEAKHQLEEAQKAAANDETGARLKAVQDEFEAYKADIAKAQAEATAKSLYKTELEGLNVTGKRADSIVKATDLSAFEIADGKYADPEKVREAIRAEWGDLIPRDDVRGAATAHPPATSGGVAAPSSLADAIRERYTEKG